MYQNVEWTPEQEAEIEKIWDEIAAESEQQPEKPTESDSSADEQ